MDYFTKELKNNSQIIANIAMVEINQQNHLQNNQKNSIMAKWLVNG